MIADDVRLDEQASVVLREFLEFVQDFRTIPALIAKMAWVAPLADLLLAIGPPWPSRVGVSLLVTIAEVLATLYAFEFWKGHDSKIAQVRKIFKCALWCTVGVFPVYILLFANFVEDSPDRWHRDVVGYRFLNEDMATFAREKGLSNYELLRMFLRPEAVWTRSSVVNMRVAVLLVWLLEWGCASMTIAAFVSLQWKRAKKTRLAPAS